MRLASSGLNPVQRLLFFCTSKPVSVTRKPALHSTGGHFLYDDKGDLLTCVSPRTLPGVALSQAKAHQAEVQLPLLLFSCTQRRECRQTCTGTPPDHPSEGRSGRFSSLLPFSVTSLRGECVQQTAERSTVFPAVGPLLSTSRSPCRLVCWSGSLALAFCSPNWGSSAERVFFLDSTGKFNLAIQLTLLTPPLRKGIPLPSFLGDLSLSLGVS